MKLKHLVNLLGEDWDVYAEVMWTVEDILELRPEWSHDQAQTWLENNQGRIRDRLTELGYEVISDLMDWD